MCEITEDSIVCHFVSPPDLDTDIDLWVQDGVAYVRVGETVIILETVDQPVDVPGFSTEVIHKDTTEGE